MWKREPFKAETTIPLCTDTIDADWLKKRVAEFPKAHGGHVLAVPDGDDWLPTPHGHTFSDALYALPPQLFKGRRVVELGGGIGTQTVPVLAAGPAEMIITEISEHRHERNRATLRANNLLPATDNTAAATAATTTVKHIIADWMRWSFTADVLLTCPPFAMGGQPYRRHYIDTLLHLARGALSDNGTLIFAQSSMADIEKTVEILGAYKFGVSIVRAADYFWRDYYSQDPTFLQEAEELQVRTKGAAFGVDDSGRRVERLYVIVATKLPWSAHLKH